MPVYKKANQVQISKGGVNSAADASASLGSSNGAREKTRKSLRNLDPNKRYLSLNVASGRAFVGFVNPRDDEHLSVSFSFLKNRFHSKHVRAGCEFDFNETFIFEFEGDHSSSKFDSSALLKLNQPVHICVLRHRKNERPVVIGTKNLDWRALLFSNSIEINAEIMPVDLTHKGSLGVLSLNLDLVPKLSKQEFIGEDQVTS